MFPSHPKLTALQQDKVSTGTFQGCCPWMGVAICSHSTQARARPSAPDTRGPPGCCSGCPTPPEGAPEPASTYAVVVLYGLPREVEHGPRDYPLAEEVSDLKVRG